MCGWVGVEWALRGHALDELRVIEVLQLGPVEFYQKLVDRRADGEIAIASVLTGTHQSKGAIGHGTMVDVAHLAHPILRGVVLEHSTYA